MNFHRTRYQGRDSLKDPQAQAIKAETPQANRIAARLAELRQAVNK